MCRSDKVGEETDRKYTYEEAFRSCCEYFNEDRLPASTFINKYILRDTEGNILEKTPEDVLGGRIPPEFLRIENRYPNPLSEDDIKESLKDFRYILPGGSPLFGIGNNYQYISLSNCFVVGQPHDSYAGIINLDEQIAQIQKRRGGVGIDLSTLRSARTSVKNSALTSDGVPVFMRRYSYTTGEVAQGGRRGALMESLDCRHPDIPEFIKAKGDNETDIGKANISVKWHDDFLKAVENNEEYTLRFPVDREPENAEVTRTVNARDIWDEFCYRNWLCGDPGCLFWDTVINRSIADNYIPTVSTNPCGELPLADKSACMLMSLNLSSFVENRFEDKAYFNWKEFERQVRTAARLIDDLIDLELEKIEKILDKIKSDPEPPGIKETELNLWRKIYENHRDYRRTGLGITALGDTFAMLGMSYGGDKSVSFTDKLFKYMQETVYDESAELAGERGPFKGWSWDKEKDNYYIKKLPESVQNKIKEKGRRNISSMTCAPTGSVSILAGTTAGIEPLFQMKYKRNRKLSETDKNNGVKPDYVDEEGAQWVTYNIEHEGLREWRRITGEEDPDKSPYTDSTAQKIGPEHRIRIQSAAGKHIDGSISSTVNLPEDTDKNTISDIYMRAYKAGLKGLTVFRDGCKKGILESDKDDPKEITDTSAPERPPVLPCDIHYSKIKDKISGKTHEWIFLVGKLYGRVYELFGGYKKNISIPGKYDKGWLEKEEKKEGNKKYTVYNLILGSLEDDSEKLEVYDIASTFKPDPGSYTRMLSLPLRFGVPLSDICNQLLKDSEEADLFSFEKGISRVLRKYVKNGEKAAGICPSCGQKSLAFIEGCMTCTSCGASKCD